MGGNQGLHVLVLLLIFGMSAISWVIGKLREQAAIKRMRDEMKRRQEDELRTGRAVEPAPSTKNSELTELRDLAARRQQQLREMRDLQSRREQQSQRSVPVGPGIPLPVPRPTGVGGGRGPGMPGVPRMPQPVATPRPMGAMKKPEQSQPQRMSDSQLRAPSLPPPRARQSTPDAPRTLRVTSAAARPRAFDPDAAEPSRGVQGAIEAAALNAGRKPTTAELRRAIVMSEMLAPPMSLRPIGEGR